MQGKIWKRAGVGAALLALGMVFNQAANAPALAQALPPGSPAALAEGIPPVPLHDRQMMDAIEGALQRIGQQSQQDPQYDPAQDSTVQSYADQIIDALRQGAHGAFVPPPSTNAEGQATKRPPAFTVSIQLAVMSGRADIVDAFIAAGASAKPLPDAHPASAPMAIAANIFMQAQEQSKRDAAHALAVIRRLEAAGGALTDVKDTRNQPFFKSYKDLAVTLTGVEVMQEAGVKIGVTVDDILHGPADARADLADETRLTRAFVARNRGDSGGLIHEQYEEAYPGGAELLPLYESESLVALAQRHYKVMGEPDVLSALGSLMRLNKLPRDAVIASGASVRIPVQATVQLGNKEFSKPTDLRAFAADLLNRGQFYKKDASTDDAVRELALLNGLTPEQTQGALDGTYLFPAYETLGVPVYNDSFGHLSPAPVPPTADPARRVDMVVIENKDYHGKRTFTSATATAYALDPQVDFSRFVSWDDALMGYGTPSYSPALRALLGDPASPLRDRVIFSMSMEMTSPMKPALEARRQGMHPDNPEFAESMAVIAALEQSAPTLFLAAGNQYDKGEGRFTQGHKTVHGPQSYVIGAAGRYPVTVDGKKTYAHVIAPYSTGGAAVCGALPYYQTYQQEGTSFSDPATASTFREFSEKYGNILTHDEIFAAAMMTATRTVLDYTNAANASKAFVTDDVPPAFLEVRTASFAVNGAGLPYNERCGAGVVDVPAWQAALDRMVQIKAEPEVAGRETGHILSVSTGETVRDGGPDDTYYSYSVTVPEDMTADKMTFVLPQFAGQYSDVSVAMPSGFVQRLPLSMTNVVSSFAFAYEDLRAGDTIELRTQKPLADNAAIVLRGQTGNNAIARLRDEMRAAGTLPEPLTRLGGTASPVPPPAPPAGWTPRRDGKDSGFDFQGTVDLVKEQEETPAPQP